MHGEFDLQGGNIFEGGKPTGKWQDKAPQGRSTAGSDQPYTTGETAVYQTKEHGSEKRCTAHVSSRIPPHVKTGLLELAEANGWSESKVVAEACTAYLEQDLGEKFGRRLAQQVTEAVRGELKKDSNRQAYLSVHGYYAAEESRIMNAKVLRYLFGEETEMYTQTLKQARHEAYSNLKHKVEEKPETQV